MLLAACMVLTAVLFGNFFLMQMSAKTGVSVQMQIGKTKVTKKTYQMETGASRQLKVKALENKRSVKITDVQYRSSDKKIASVSKSGVIRAKASGTAKITAAVKTKRGNRTAWLKVKVNEVQPDGSGEKILIAYFTRSGNTEKLADMIADKTGGTKFRIETETAYPQDYDAVLEQASQEREQNARPLLKTRVENMSDYGTVFLGYAGGIIGLN